MSLPIDAEAIAAQTKAEHEYGERLMDLAEYSATMHERDSVTAEDVEKAAGHLLIAVKKESAFWQAAGEAAKRVDDLIVSGAPPADVASAQFVLALELGDRSSLHLR